MVINFLFLLKSAQRELKVGLMQGLAKNASFEERRTGVKAKLK